MEFKVVVGREDMSNGEWQKKWDTHEFIAERMVEGGDDTFTKFIDRNSDLVAAFPSHDIESVFTDNFEEPA